MLCVISELQWQSKQTQKLKGMSTMCQNYISQGRAVHLILQHSFKRLTGTQGLLSLHIERSCAFLYQRGTGESV